MCIFVNVLASCKITRVRCSRAFKIIIKCKKISYGALKQYSHSTFTSQFAANTCTNMNNDTIREAVALWKENPEQCVATWGHMQDWDVSNVTNMSRLFVDCFTFNEPIGNWNVSSVVDMRGMFYRCSKFNEPIGNWNVSNVTNMNGMFYGCSEFNEPIGNWNVSFVTDMCCMFYGCNQFNQPIGNWNVLNVTSMSWMFRDCKTFNQPIGNWNVSNVTDMSGMFNHCKQFNKPIGNWNVLCLKYCWHMFYQANNFLQPFGKQWLNVCCNYAIDYVFDTQLNVCCNKDINYVFDTQLNVCCNKDINYVFDTQSKYHQAIVNSQNATSWVQPQSPFDVPVNHPFSKWNRRKHLVAFYAFCEKNEDLSIYNGVAGTARVFESCDINREICAFL